MADRNRGFSAVLVILLVGIIAAVVGLAYYLGSNKSAPSKTVSPTPKISPTTTSGSTSNWKLFSGQTAYGDSFIIKYPPEWALKETFRGKGILYPSGKIPQEDNSTDPVIVLGAGGHGGGFPTETKDFPAGKANYFFDENGWFASFEESGNPNTYIFEASYGIPSKYSKEEYENLVIKMLSTFSFKFSD